MSSSGLYGYKANVTVSANNLTTLYSAQPGNVVVVDVPDRNFTTLYTNQSTISPTKAYGNSNVEAFLNAGTDGANSVQNIRMSGNIYVGGSSFLGNVGNVHITGGNSGYVLTTNGVGNLIWAEPSGGSGSGTDYIHFDVTTTANNQQFTDTNLSAYANANVINLFKNGVNLEPFYFEKVSNTTIQVNIPLQSGDTIDILASSGGGGGGLPGGSPNTVQYNDGFALAGSNNFTFDSSTNTLSITNIVTSDLTANGQIDLGSVANLQLTGGNNGSVLSTDGLGNLSWTDIITVQHANVADYANVANLVSVANVSGIGNIATVNLDGNGLNVLHGDGTWSVGSGVPGGANTQVQFNDSGVFGGVSGFTFDKTTTTLAVAQIAGNGSGLFSLTGANVSGAVSTATHATVADSANTVAGVNVTGTVALANFAAYASNVTSSSQPNITSLGTLTNLTVSGMTSIQEAKEQWVSTDATNVSVQFNILDSAIALANGTFPSNFTINIRGNGSTTFDSIVSNTQTVSLTFIAVGGTGLPQPYMTQLYIDGSPVTVNWASGIAPTSGTENGYDLYQFNIVKVDVASYIVFGVMGSYN